MPAPGSGVNSEYSVNTDGSWNIEKNVGQECVVGCGEPLWVVVGSKQQNWQTYRRYPVFLPWSSRILWLQQNRFKRIFFPVLLSFFFSATLRTPRLVFRKTHSSFNLHNSSDGLVLPYRHRTGWEVNRLLGPSRKLTTLVTSACQGGRASEMADFNMQPQKYTQPKQEAWGMEPMDLILRKTVPP